MKTQIVLVLLVSCFMIFSGALVRRGKRKSDQIEQEHADLMAEYDVSSAGDTSDEEPHSTSPSSGKSDSLSAPIDLMAELTAETWLESADSYSSGMPNHCGAPYKGEVLTYITPWNNKGYDRAKVIAKKITWLSPVWFQIRQNDQFSGADDEPMFVITGSHDVDEGWLADVRKLNRRIKVVPRVVLEADLTCPTQGRDDDCTDISTALETLRRRFNFEGWVFEIPLESWKTTAVLTAHAKQSGAMTVMVLPPLDPADDAEGYEPYAGLFHVFERIVDRYSVMTYDYTRTGEAIAPFPWVEQVIGGLASITQKDVRSKLLLGIPMYGWSSKRQ